MKTFTRIFAALFLVATKSTFALRQATQNGALMSIGESDNVAEALVSVDAIMASIQESVRIMDDMIAHLSTRPDNLVDEVCEGTGEDSTCRESVRAYVSRCLQHDCFRIDGEKYPADKEYQPLTLPDPYQLDAAFRLFKDCDSNASKNPVERFWMRFKHGGRYGAYHNFIMNVLASNQTESPDNSEIEDFVNKYLYMATMYYKTYLILDSSKANIINKADFTRHIFGKSIKNMLEKIIRNHLPEDFGVYSIERLSHISAGFADYMLKHIPNLPTFASRYNDMVVEMLHKVVGKYQKQPWYKKLFSNVKGFFTNKYHPARESIRKNIKHPVRDFWRNKIAHPVKNIWNKDIAEPTKDFFTNKEHPTRVYVKKNITHPVKNFWNKDIAEPTKNFWNKDIAEPAKDFFTNKVPAAFGKPKQTAPESSEDMGGENLRGAAAEPFLTAEDGDNQDAQLPDLE